MSRRDKSLAATIAMIRDRAAGAPEDPFAGVPPQLMQSFLYSTNIHGRRFGAPGPGDMHIHRHGWNTAHEGSCAVSPAEPIEERLVRWGGLDRDEAELLRQLVKDAHHDAGARVLGVSLRTIRRRDAAIRRKLRDAGVLDLFE